MNDVVFNVLRYIIEQAESVYFAKTNSSAILSMVEITQNVNASIGKITNEQKLSLNEEAGKSSDFRS